MCGNVAGWGVVVVGQLCVEQGEHLPSDKMVLKGLYCSFGSVDSMIVGLNEQEVAVLCGEEAFDLTAGLIVHYVQFYCESFLLEEFELLFVCFEYRGVFHVLNWEAEYCI